MYYTIDNSSFLDKFYFQKILNKLENKTSEKEQRAFDQEAIIGYILSTLFGLVFVEIITNFSQIVDGLRYSYTPFSYEFASFATLVFCINIFRMFHGYMISMYDTRNPTYFGPYPYSLYELFVLVSSFIFPLISTAYMKMGNNINPISILIAYQIPMLLYILWDTGLKNDLKKIINDDEARYDEARIDKKNKARDYLKFVKSWLLLDYINLGIFFVILFFFLFDVINSHYNIFLFCLATISLAQIIYDYYFENKLFYFPERKEIMPPSGYTKHQTHYMIDFLKSVSDSLKREGVEFGLTPIQALEKELGNIDTIYKNYLDLSNAVLLLTKVLYRRILDKNPQNFEDFDNARMLILQEIENEILSISVPKINASDCSQVQSA